MLSFMGVVSYQILQRGFRMCLCCTAQLIAVRLLIGLFEAGFYPTAVFYLSTFYTRFDLAVRIALFYGQYAIAGAFSGAIGMCANRTSRVDDLTSTSLWSIST
jgi:MFS family permease